MAKGPKDIEINGNKYMIGMCDPDTGDEIIAYLAKVAGPAALAMFANKEKDTADIGRVAAGALSNLHGPEHAAFMRKLLSFCTINGQPAASIYDAHFLGNHGERYQAAKAVIEHNGFFDVVAALGQ